MKAHEISLGGVYLAKVSNILTKVRVDDIRETDRFGTYSGRASKVYDVTNLRTGRKTTFRSAAKFRGEYLNGEYVVYRSKDHIVTVQESITSSTKKIYNVYNRYDTSRWIAFTYTFVDGMRIANERDLI